jgi:hypothetical protein
MNITKRTLSTALILSLAAAGTAQAQFKLPAALGGSTPAAAPATATGTDAAVSQDSLVRTFVASQTEVLAAQQELALAYDLKDQAALIASEQQALSSGGVTEASQIQTSLQVSDNANAAIAAKQAEQSNLSDEGKQHYAASLPHFLKGVVGTRQLVLEATKFGASAKSSMASGGLTGLAGGLTKLKAGAYVAKSTPSYSKQVFDAFRKTVAIGQSNGVKMPTDATKALTDLSS